MADLKAEPPGGGRQDHAAMRTGSMRPVDGPASTGALAASGGLDVPGREPESTLAAAADLADVSSAPEIIPGAYESNTAMRREAGGFGGHFNGDDTISPDADVMMAADVREEHRLEGGGEKHERRAKAED